MPLDVWVSTFAAIIWRARAEFRHRRWKLGCVVDAWLCAAQTAVVEAAANRSRYINHLKQLREYWSRVVYDYSERQLGKIDDNFMAISAIGH